MKTSRSKPQLARQFERAPAIHAPQLPRNFEQIRKCAQEICRRHGGIMGMTLNDWLQAGQELKRSSQKETNGTENR
jgi:hypothetical protein